MLLPRQDWQLIVLAALGLGVIYVANAGLMVVVTYWGHVSRVRIYFEQCFDGPVYVTDTPRPLTKSRKDALLHETGGYFKAFLKPAC